ncbi:MAG: hypothetical protein ACAI38_07165 [Myxococcota bacterium]|nr:hypothetical protein [Myxococcota bacterium]
MSQRGFGKTVLGWFVVDEDGDKSTDADALIAKYAAQEVQAPPVELKGPLPQVVDGNVDFQKVYAAAGLAEDERGRVGKAQELLRSLPAETSAPVKKQIVEASLKAFGVPTDKIIESAVSQIEALEAFIRAGQADTQKILSDGATRVADLEREIAEVKKVMQQAVTDQEVRTGKTNNEKLAVQQVLEFFGVDAVAKVVSDSPKLHQPS